MNRCGSEHAYSLALTLLDFEPLGLYDHAQTLYEEDAAENREQQFFMDDDGTYTNDTTDGQRACVAHEHLGREGIIPQETDHGSDECTKEYHQLLGVGDIHNVEVGGIADVGRHIGQDA